MTEARAHQQKQLFQATELSNSASVSDRRLPENNYVFLSNMLPTLSDTGASFSSEVEIYQGENSSSSGYDLVGQMISLLE